MAERRIAGRYEVLQFVGRGGEASVIKAVDTRHDRMVALKIRPAPHPGRADGVLAEARALLSLPAHPGLAHARDDLFDDDGRHVLVLDWVDGVDLGHLLAEAGRPGLPVSSVLRWSAQTADALSVLHRHGVYHGDVKPANLILDRTGRVVVVDLGSSSAANSNGPTGGTPLFRAPEVAAGAMPTRASDVFSLAATVFALLTGSAPSGGLPTWNGVPADVASRLEAELRAGLAIDPARRPASPGEFVERLRAGWDDQTPTGVGTVLVCDVVDSTELWRQVPEQVPALLAEMQLAVDRSVEEQGGRRVGATVEGDATISVFANAVSAARAAIELHRSLATSTLAARLRAGLATGEITTVDGDVVGPTVSRAVRVRDLARAGEVLLSGSTAAVVGLAPPPGVALLRLGGHELRGLDGVDEIAAVVADGVAAPPDPARSPYPGLAPFAADDADLFFGREDIVDRCVAQFRSNRFVAIVGASGSGKTSVALAGLAARLTNAVVLRPGQHPLQTLGEAHADDAVLIVDQLEEVITLCRDPAERAAFIDAIHAHPGGLIVTVRADLYGDLGTFTAFADRLASSHVLLGPLGDADVTRAVEEPARRCGLDVEEGLTEIIAAELGKAPGALPLLGHALREAWLRRDGRTITVAGYRASGGVRSAIAATAERSLGALDDDGQSIARHLLLRMVELRPDGDDARRWISRTEAIGIDPRRAAAVIATLADARLLVLDREQMTVAHEAVLQAWPRLSGWIAEERAELLVLQELRGATERWTAGGRSDADVLRGPRLDTAIEVSQRARMPADSAEFLVASRRLRAREFTDSRRRTRRLRALAATTSVLALIAAVVGGIAVWQRNDAERSRDAADEAARNARVEALVGRAESLRDTQRDTAALLAVEAYSIADTARTRSTLFATFTDGAGFLDARRFAGEGGGTGIVMPDGESAYLVDQEGRLRPYDLDSGAQGDPLAALGATPDPASILAASADGRRLVQAARTDLDDGPSTVGIFDTATNSLIAPPIVVDGPVWSATFTPGDRRLAVVTGEGARLLVIDTATGSEVASVPGVAVPPDDTPWYLEPQANDVGHVVRRPSAVAIAGDELLVGSSDGSLRVFDARTIELRRTIILAPGTLASLRPLDDGTLVTAGRLGLSRVDLATGAVDWQRDDQARCTNLTVIEQRGTFYCGDAYGRLEERDLATGQTLRRLDVQDGKTGALWPARDGTELVSFGDNEPVVSRWRLDGSGPVTRVVAPGWTTFMFNPGSDRLLIERGTPLVDYVAMVIDIESGDTVATLSGLENPNWLDADTITGVILNDDGQIELAHIDIDVDVDTDTAEIDTDGMVIDAAGVTEANLDTGKEQIHVVYRNGPDTTLVAFDPATQHLGPRIAVDGYVSSDISRTGDRIVAGTDHGIEVYDASTGEQLGAIPTADLRGVFITVADQLFVSSIGGELAQYDLASLEPIRTFAGSRGYVVDGFGTADGTLVATIGGDHTVTLYDVASGVRIGTSIIVADDEKNRLALSLDGDWLAVGGEPGDGQHTIQIWDLDPEHWATAACSVAGRNLTNEEWSTYIGDLAPYRATCPSQPSDD